MNQEVERKSRRWVVALLVVLPLWMAVSGGIGLWIWWRGQVAAEQAGPAKFATAIEAGALASDVRKLVEIAGPRGVGSEEERTGLDRAEAMIESSIGPSNAGYVIEKMPAPPTPEGRAWPVMVATLQGDERPPLWVVAGYDTAVANPVEANATGLAAVLAVANALSGERLGRPVKFGFLPHVYDDASPVLKTLDAFTRWMGEAETVLVVEAMGAGEELWISSRDAKRVSRPTFEESGKVVGAEVVCLEDDFDLSSVLFEMNRPAVRVATRPVVAGDEQAAELPDAEAHARATEKLAALVRALAE